MTVKLHLIRHGKTEANEKRLYCGHTDIPLSEQGRMEIISLKETIMYPKADVYITSGLVRTSETMSLIYERGPDIVMNEFMEMNFGAFEMHSYEDLKDKPEYQYWIDNIETAACPEGESRVTFEKRIFDGLDKLFKIKKDSFAVICHGGVIVSVMERFFPGQKNFYEWQPGFGRGYTIEICREINGNASLVGEI
jgi:alpha-ribazole phosphatase